MNKRLFVAMPLPREVKEALTWVQEKLKEDLNKKDIKWVEKKNLHQTMVFLGKVEEARIPEVKEIMERLARQKVLNLTLTKLGFYPELRRARIIWIGLGGEDSKVSSYFHKLRLPLQMAKFEFDTRFSSHITVGRVKKTKEWSMFSDRKISLVQDFLRNNRISFQTKKLVLYESKLTPTGPLYHPIFEVKLKKN